MHKTIIHHVQLLLPEGFVPGAVLVEDGKIARILTETESADEIVDGHGAYCFPGMVDIHFHGCMGADVCDGTLEALRTIAAYEASIGVTAICPATMTLPAEELERVLRTMAAFRRRQEPGLAELVGINMEGPFISPAKKGAQDPTHIRKADNALFDRFWAASGESIAYMGLAPEENCAEEVETFISHVRERGSRVSLCHTNASYDQAMHAIACGANHAIHLYDGMSPMLHRAPGVPGAVADSPSVDAELICDGIHVHPAVVRATFAMLGADRIVLISDSMRAAGLGDGAYTLGGLGVTVHGREAVLAGDPSEGGGAYAGSVTTLPDMVRTVVREMHIPLETALRCATYNAARSIGIGDRFGQLAEGRQADLVLWNAQLETVGVMQRGVWI